MHLDGRDTIIYPTADNISGVREYVLLAYRRCLSFFRASLVLLLLAVFFIGIKPGLPTVSVGLRSSKWLALGI